MKSDTSACSQESEDSSWVLKAPMIMNPKLNDYNLRNISPAIIATCYKEPPVILNHFPRSSKTGKGGTISII